MRGRALRGSKRKLEEARGSKRIEEARGRLLESESSERKPEEGCLRLRLEA